MRKKHILLNWESSRADLMEPFIALQDHFTFSVIWYKEPPDHPLRHPFKEYYFGDFSTPYQLLKQVKPDTIIFFGIHSFPQIALNLAAKNKGLPTYTMHHGVFSSNLADITQMRKDMGIVKKRRIINSLSSFYFYFSALRPKNWRNFVKYSYFPFLLHKYGSVEALKKCVFEARLPYKYIQLSPHNSIVYKELDQLKNDDKFHYIGHPAFDKFLTQVNEEAGSPIDEKYWLLIDFPNKETNIGFAKIGWEAKLTFYQQLSALAKKNGSRLRIKLHPAGYVTKYSYEDENIDLLKETDITRQIIQAERCFSFYSTLLIPIIYIKHHCVVFDLGLNIGLQRELVELGVARLLPISDLSERDMLVSGEEMDTATYEEFVARYIYRTDGRATARLKQILISDEDV